MKCPSCGAEMILDPASGKLLCEYCGTTMDPGSSAAPDPEAEAARKERERKAREARKIEADGGYYEATTYACQVCGAELRTTDDTAVTFCSYCGSQSILPGRVEKLKKPAFIIPFSRTKADCEAAYRQVLKKAKFIPRDMVTDETIQKFRGIYMPYWVYDMHAGGNIVTRGSSEYRRGDYIYKKHYRLWQSGEATYDKISFDASSSFSDNLSQCIAPYDVREGKPFDTSYLSGYYSDVADVNAEVYKPDAEAIASEHLSRQLYYSDVYGRYNVPYREVADAIPMRTRGEKLGLFPVWFLGCRSKDGTRVSYAVVNGQTGKVAADLPIDFGRYVRSSLILAIPIFVALMLLTLTPSMAMLGSMIVAALGLFFTNSQLNEIYARENQLDDKGRMVHTWEEEKQKEKPPVMPGSRKNKYLIKPILSLVISLAIFILSPASDLIYYGAICLSMAVMLLNFYDLVQGHNSLTMRKLPQMEARGGDEHE